jgi:S1-C subfamily serine protease
MKILSYRSTMPFDNRGTDGSPSLSPSTQKGIMPFLNVPTVQDIIERKIDMKDYNPHSMGDWAPGEDVEKNYREEADDYKRRERDMGILKFMTEPRDKSPQKWTVKIPGGSKTFMSFELARQYTREKNLPFSYVRRVAQNTINNSQEQLRIDVIADSLKKTFMVESINVAQGVRDNGSAFCVAPNHFITCAHVIRSYNKMDDVGMDYFADAIISIIDGNRKSEAYIVSIDPKLDIALIRANVDSEPLGIDIGSEVGYDIIAIGSPHGYENNVSTGTIGSLGRKVYFYKGAPEYMFVDLSIFPGNSGGPVIRVDNGKVVGMVTLIVAAAGGYGLNAALPSSYIADFCRKNIKGFQGEIA